MIRPARGSAVLVLLSAALSACVGPMAAREAQDLAQDRMARYCQNRCGTLHLTRAQKIKDRWLVDFDSPARRFTVTVDNGGNTKVDVWDKTS